MRWGSELYVKLFKRDTAEWLAVSWQARGLFYELMRKADREGRIALGKMVPAKALGVLLRADPRSLEAPLAELLEDGCVVNEGAFLLLRNFVEAQTTPATAAARKRNVRESLKMSREGTSRHEMSQREEKRQEEKRQDEKRTEALPAAAPPPPRLAPEPLELGIPAAPPPAPKATTERVNATASVVALKRAASDERFGPWIGTLKRVFADVRGADLAVNGRDGKRLKQFLAENPKATETEAEARWRRALSLGSRWPGCATVAHFCDRWNELAGDAPAQTKVTAAAAGHAAFSGKEVLL